MDRLERHGHAWMICTLGEVDPAVPTPIACLLGVCRGELPEPAASLIDSLADKGCRLFCFVGPASEMVHDSFDWRVVDKELFEVVTTWDPDVDGWPEAVSMPYSMKPGTVLCVILDDDEMSARRLRKAIETWPA
jgi:hypothetical protein